MSFLANFFTGAFLCNAIPHLAAGLQGRSFPTPFATPHGVGHSSAVVNVLWGFVNLIAGLALLAAFPAPIALAMPFGLVCLGALALGVFLAWHFSTVASRR